MKNYFLIARNRETNQFKVVHIEEDKYLGIEGSGFPSRSNSLETFDLLSTTFRSREEMIEMMYKQGYINSENVDLFIAKRNKRDGIYYIYYYELIYNPDMADRISDFRNISFASLSKDISKEKERIDKLFDKLASRVYYKGDYRMMLVSQMTGVPKKLTDCFSSVGYRMKPPYNIKYTQRWATTSYSIIRNIIESMNRYDLLKKTNQNILKANVDFLNANGSARKRIEAQLLKVMDKNYIEGQYELFSNEEETLIPVSEDVIKSGDVEVEKAISSDDKLATILMVIDSLPMEAFKKIDDRMIFNTDIFRYGLSDEDKINLDKLLSKRLISYIYQYVLHNDKYQDALKNYSNTYILEGELRQDMATLKKSLSNPKNLDRTFLWCDLYSRCMEKEDVYKQLIENGEQEVAKCKKINIK